MAEEAKAICADGNGGDSAACVEILDVRKTYKSYQLDPSKQVRRAVNGVSLKMMSSQCFALLGHNGAGKTVHPSS